MVENDKKNFIKTVIMWNVIVVLGILLLGMVTIFVTNFVIDAKSLIANELNIQPQDIEIFEENDQQLVDPKNKSRFSRPYKPAIYIQ